MADDSGQVEILITLDDGSVQRGFIKAQKAGEDAASGISAAFGRVGEKIFSVFAGVALERIFEKATSAVKDFAVETVKAAANNEAAINKLNNSLSSAGQNSQATLDSFIGLAKSISETSTVSQTAAINLEAFARNFTHTNDQAKALTKAAVDLSAQLGVGLNEAAAQIGATFSGVVPRGLGRTVFALKTMSEAQLKAGEGVAAIAARFKGAAENEVNTFAGGIQVIKNRIQELQEAIGKFVVRSPALLAAFKVVRDTISDVTKSLNGASGDDIFKPILLSAINLGRVLNDFVIIPFEIVQATIRAAIDGIAGIAFGVLEKLASAAYNVVSYFKPNSELAYNLQAFKEFAGSMFHDLGADADEKIKGILTAYSGPNAISEFFDKASASISATSGKLNEFKATTKNTSGDFGDQMKRIEITAREVALAINQAIVGSISKSIQTMITNIRNGANAFKGVLGVIGSIMGEMLIKLGESVLAVGIGLQALGASLATLQGGPAIAAGIALIAAGSVLKAASGGAAQGAAEAGIGGGGGSIAPPSIAGPDRETPISQTRAPSVTVEIHGSVFDTKETGLRIVDIINGAFKDQGARVLT